MIAISEGLYEIDDINQFLRTQLGVEYRENDYYQQVHLEK